jgi:hypothetical protein
MVAEMKDLYFHHGIRIFNFQDDNFFLPQPEKAARRFEELRDSLREEGVHQIAIAVKARPDSITRKTISILDDLGLFRVFLGVENASENGLKNLNRKNSINEILNALEILNEFDVHLAYNLLMFEPRTTLDDILVNLRFMERHIENPFNFCRAEAYAGTGLESQLLADDKLEGDYFGFDYRLEDPHCEAFHQVANYAFFERNFSDFGLHYFNMQVDFYFQLLRRFHTDYLSQNLRATVRNFIKQTNLDTFECLSQIYDFIVRCDPHDRSAIHGFAREMRWRVDDRSAVLLEQGQRIIDWLEETYRTQGTARHTGLPVRATQTSDFLGWHATPYTGLDSLIGQNNLAFGEGEGGHTADTLEKGGVPMPYSVFKTRMEETKEIASS